MTRWLRKKPPVGRKPSLTARGQGVFSYYATGSQPASSLPPTKPRSAGKYATLWLYLPTILAAAGLLVSLIYGLKVATHPKVVIAGDTAAQPLLRPAAVYEKKGQELLGHSIFNRNKLTLDIHDIENNFRQDFPELDSVGISVPIMGSRPVIVVHAAQPALRLASKGGTVVLDTTGKAVVKDSDSPDIAKAPIPLVTDESGLSATVGHNILPANNVLFIQTIVAQLAAKQLTVASITLPTTPGQLIVRVQNVPYYIKFNLMSDARQQVGTFLAVKQKLDTDKVTPAEYIDVRVDERAYYK